jgi:hypothetical protein
MLYLHHQEYCPDGTITKALHQLPTVANKLAENSREDNPFNSLKEQWFENGKAWWYPFSLP